MPKIEREIYVTAFLLSGGGRTGRGGTSSSLRRILCVAANQVTLSQASIGALANPTRVCVTLAPINRN